MSYECPDCILVSQSYVEVFLLRGGVLVTTVVLFLTYGTMSLNMGGGMFKMKHDASDFTSKQFNNKDNNAIEMRLKQIKIDIKNCGILEAKMPVFVLLASQYLIACGFCNKKKGGG